MISKPKATNLIISGCFILATVQLTSCRSPRRGIRVGSDAAKLSVTMSGLSNDAGKDNWIYELSGCLPPLNGELGADGKVSFSAIGLKAGLENCQFRVKTSQASASIKYIEGSEPNVLYWAKEMTISQDASGQLVSDASLQKLYETVVPNDARKSFTLKIPVHFSKAETETLVTGTLTCSPEIANIGRYYTKTDDTNGELVFTLPIEADVAYACTDLYLGAAGVPQKYKGSFVGESGKFTGSADKTVTLDKLDVIFQQTTTNTDTKGNVSVSTKGEECNQEGKVFDVATGECKTK